MSGGITDHGFEWGPMEVVRAAAFDRGTQGITRVVIVRVGGNPKPKLTIYVSPTGRSVRVFDAKGRELKAQ